MIPNLPGTPGSYALFLALPQPVRLQVGRLGEWDFPAGDYAYLGSALGTGGLCARVSRHIRGGKPHWHIDHLLRVAHPRAVAYLLLDSSSNHVYRMECAWSQALVALPGAALPVPGFGASDCRAGCPAHLVRLSTFEVSILSVLSCVSVAPLEWRSLEQEYLLEESRNL